MGNLKKLFYINNLRIWSSHLYGYKYDQDISNWISKFLEKENLQLLNFGNDPNGLKLIDLPDSKEAFNV